jgi:nitroimidazol reductase NimA-like FMN-containing flavoprotein (pyridoxamine 5'-phosphate oxidase superfamily)
MFGKLNEAEIDEVLTKQVLGRIGCHNDGITYIVPISYAYDGNYIYCHTREGMKVNMMRKNPKVCFEVDEIINMANWKNVIAWGEFEELTTPANRETALNCLVNRILPVISSETTHISAHWPFPPKDMDEIKGLVFRIRLQIKTGRFEKNEHAFEYASL